MGTLAELWSYMLSTTIWLTFRGQSGTQARDVTSTLLGAQEGFTEEGALELGLDG